MAVLNGTNNNDTLNGTIDVDTLNGGMGNDLLNGDTANDTLNGDEGNDSLNGGAGDDLLNGGPETDLGHNTTDVDILNGGLGNDMLNGGLGNDLLNGDIGNDLLTGGSGADTLNGGVSDDLLHNESDADTLTGGAGDDLLSGGAGDDALNGGVGNDVLNGDTGNDVLNGNAGNDTLNGGVGNDALNGDSGNDTLNGDSGNDTLNGAGGNDLLFGGDGNDVLSTVEVLGNASGNANEFVYYSSATNGATALASALFQPDSGIQVVSASYTGADTATSFFSSFSYGLGQLEAGILLTSGDGKPSASNTSSGFGVNNNTAGDAQLNTTIAPVFPGKNSFDAVVLNIEFTLTDTSATQISLDMVFGSEEYPEFADSFVDVAAIYVDGINYAYFNNGLPLSVLKSNFGEIIDNSQNTFPIEYDGISDVLKFSGNLVATADGRHTIRIAIADIGDGILDSGLFISNLQASTGSVTGTAGISSGVDDVLDGGVGADSMAAGYGADIYIVDNVGDVVTEQANQGVDTVKSSVSYVLANNVENITLTGIDEINATGNNVDNIIIGNNANNVLSGKAGNDIYVFNVGNGQDTIENFDTTGTDKLIFGAGIDPAKLEFRNDPHDGPNDLLIVIKDSTDSIRIRDYFKGDDYRLDSIQFADGTIWDKTKITSMPIVIGRVVIMGTDGNDTLIGTMGNDSIVGLGGDDILDGRGGSDTLLGGQGDDTYIVDNINDNVIERSDTVFSVSRINTTAVQGEAWGGMSNNGVFSPNGTQIVFESAANNLVEGDTNNSTDLFMKNQTTGIITRINTDSAGEQATGVQTGVQSSHAAFSLDGSQVVFESDATNLVTADANGKSDIFVKNLITGELTRVSAIGTGSTQVEANNASSSASFSADGKKVIFASMATNLVTGDSNVASDIFIKDLMTGAVTRISTTSTGTEANGNSVMPHFSSDGSRVVFVSDANNLVTNDNNILQDVFVKNILTQEVTRINVTKEGIEANGKSDDAVMSEDGTKVLFSSDANNLVSSDTNNVRDLFVKDLATGNISRLSTTQSGSEGNAASYYGQFSADGQYVVFVSSASNLVVGDNNGLRDVFIKHLATGVITRVSSATDGTQGNGVSAGNVSFSANGEQIVFQSAANNFAVNDNNGLSDIFVATLAYSNNGIYGDTVKSTVSYELGNNLEHLTLTGSAAIQGTGNALNNKIIGNSGDNSLTGGMGNDTLSGGIGTDTAVYASSWLNYDVVGNKSNAIVTARTGTTDGVDTLDNIEKLQFNSVKVTVETAVNDAPIGVDDENINDQVLEAGLNVTGDANAAGNVLTNDTDADSTLGLGETKAVSAINGNTALVGVAVEGMYGHIVINADGSYSYTLNNADSDTEQLVAAQAVVDTFSYTVVDGHGLTGLATVSIHITGSDDAQNHAPIGVANAVLTAGTEDSTYIVHANDLLQGFSDADNDTLTVSGLTTAEGTIVDNGNGTYRITPTQNFNGNLSLHYNVVDNRGGVLAATQSIMMMAVNDTPIGTATTVLAAGTEDTAYTLTTAALLAGFSDIEDGMALTITDLTVDKGVSVLNNDGTYTITPPTNVNGNISLNYHVADSQGGILAVTRNVSIAALNDAPTGQASAVLMAGTQNTAYVVATSDLLKGFSDVDDSTLTVHDVTATHGVVVVNSNGTYSITPTVDYVGLVELSYKVVDGKGGEVLASQHFSIDAPNTNHAPTGTATAQLVAGTEDTAYTLSATDLLLGFNDVDSGNILAISGLTTPQGVIVDNANGTYTLTPSRDFNGSLSLSYNVIDNHGGVLAATQSLMISAMNDAPTGAASAVLAAGVEDTAYTVSATNLLLGFSDVDSSDTLTISGLTTAQGTIVANADHTYTITPNANYRGAVVLHYTVNDGHGGSIAATQNVQLAATNDAPTGVPTALLASAIENRAYEFTASQLLLGFSDPDSETINVINVTSNLGSVQQQTNGRYTLTPPNDYNGIIQINYTVTDGHGGSVAATQQVNVMVVTQQLMATAGADTLRGGGGNDTYIVNHINDVVVELNNASIDTVLASVDYALTANVEHLTLTGTNNINGMGNSLNNKVTGNDGSNRLEGGDGNDILSGGKGADMLIGGQGNDSYYVDDANDSVLEELTASYEFDTVYSTVNYTLSANVERLILQGTAHLNGIGNAANNTLDGNSGDNSLLGGAGDDRLNGMMGVDTMEGGLGSDLYTVDNIADVVIELADEGIDFVNSSVNYSLSANVERLFLTGTANLNGTGNALHNTIYGNSGDNILNGGDGNDTLNGQAGHDTLDGGLGNDNLKGGLGNDSYLFGLNAGQDAIDNTDAGNGNDRVLLGAGVSADQVWLRQVANSLEVSIIGTNDRLLIADWYTTPAKQVDSFELSNGAVLLAAEVQTLVTAMAAFAPPTLGNTSLNTAQHAALDNVITVSW